MPEGDTDYVDEASDAAATKVQAILRGSKARKTVTKSVACHEECIDSDAVFDAAATKVQAILRGSKARKSDAGVEVVKPDQPSDNFAKMRNSHKKPNFGGVVSQARMVHKAKGKFNNITRPRRPPFPGTATPPGYVIHKSRTRPADVSNWERGRDYSLYLGTHWVIAIVQLLWLVSLVVVFVVFMGCMFYVFDWGEVTDENWGCPTWPGVSGNSTCCTCDAGALTYKVEDYWNEKMTQGLSALFTYSVLLATPWRLSILGQCFNFHSRIPKDGASVLTASHGLQAGVDFYGKPNEMPFYHIPWGPRLAIALLLNLNTLMQLIHQVLHFVWNDVVIAFEQPYGMISLMTGPLAGCFTGAPAAIIQMYWDNQLHAREPKRFPPGIVQAIRHLFDKDIGLEEQSKEGRKSTAAATASPSSIKVDIPQNQIP